MAKRKRKSGYGSVPERHADEASLAMKSAKQGLQAVSARLRARDCTGALVSLLQASLDAGSAAAHERSGYGISKSDGLYLQLAKAESRIEKACFRKKR
jgi:hypothetical protein